METNLRTVAVTAVAPIAWGSGYLVTAELLPADRPLFGALVRALPAGLLLLLLRRQLPSGAWWWRAGLLGALNIGVFFPLVFLAAQHLPGGLAATTQAAGPLVVLGLAWLLLHERPGALRVVAAVVGLAGVALLVLRAPDGADPVGLLASAASVLVAGLGFVLVKRWAPPVDMLTSVAWQLTAGGLVLLPVALLVEGAPPALDAGAVAGFVWLGGVGGVVAYACWFHGLARMPAGAVSLVGLLNPVTGTLLGVALAGEVFGWPQAVGMTLVLGGVLAGQPGSAAWVQARLRRTRRPAVAPASPSRAGAELATRS